MALTETWIKPEDTATPAALSTNFTFSHTLCTIGRGGGTGLLISNEWKFEWMHEWKMNGKFYHLLQAKVNLNHMQFTHPAKIHFVHSKCPGVKSTRLGV